MVRDMLNRPAADRAEFQAANGLEIKAARRKWNPALHPRDSKGRFIETGGVVRLWGGKLARVVRALPNDRILVQDQTGSNEFRGRRHTTSAKWVSMVARPDGSAPTDNEQKVQDEDTKRAQDPSRGNGVARDDDGDPTTPNDPHDVDDQGRPIGDDDADGPGEDDADGPGEDDDEDEPADGRLPVNVSALPNKRHNGDGRFADVAAVRQNFLDLADRPGQKPEMAQFLRFVAGDDELLTTDDGNLTILRDGRTGGWYLTASGTGQRMSAAGEFDTPKDAARFARHLERTAPTEESQAATQPVFDFSAPDLDAAAKTWRSGQGENIQAAIERAREEFDNSTPPARRVPKTDSDKPPETQPLKYDWDNPEGMVTLTMPSAVAEFVYDPDRSTLEDPDTRKAYDEAKRGRTGTLKITAPLEVHEDLLAMAEVLSGAGADATPAEMRGYNNYAERVGAALQERQQRERERSAPTAPDAGEPGNDNVPTPDAPDTGDGSSAVGREALKPGDRVTVTVSGADIEWPASTRGRDKPDAVTVEGTVAPTHAAGRWNTSVPLVDATLTGPDGKVITSGDTVDIRRMPQQVTRSATIDGFTPEPVRADRVRLGDVIAHGQFGHVVTRIDRSQTHRSFTTRHLGGTGEIDQFGARSDEMLTVVPKARRRPEDVQRDVLEATQHPDSAYAKRAATNILKVWAKADELAEQQWPDGAPEEFGALARHMQNVTDSPRGAEGYQQNGDAMRGALAALHALDTGSLSQGLADTLNNLENRLDANADRFDADARAITEKRKRTAAADAPKPDVSTPAPGTPETSGNETSGDTDAPALNAPGSETQNQDDDGTVRLTPEEVSEQLDAVRPEGSKAPSSMEDGEIRDEIVSLVEREMADGGELSGVDRTRMRVLEAEEARRAGRKPKEEPKPSPKAPAEEAGGLFDVGQDEQQRAVPDPDNPMDQPDDAFGTPDMFAAAEGRDTSRLRPVQTRAPQDFQTGDRFVDAEGRTHTVQEPPVRTGRGRIRVVSENGREHFLAPDTELRVLAPDEEAPNPTGEETSRNSSVPEEDNSPEDTTTPSDAAPDGSSAPRLEGATDDSEPARGRAPADMSSAELADEIEDLESATAVLESSTDPLELAYRLRAERRLWALQREEADRWQPEPEYDERGDLVVPSRGSVLLNRVTGHGLNQDEARGAVSSVDELPPAKPGGYSDDEWETIEAEASAKEEYPPTGEQQVIVEGAARRGLDMRVMALAGTGKSTTLKMLSQRMPGKRILYLAFNRSVADEAIEAQQRGEYARNLTPTTANAYANSMVERDLLDRLKWQRLNDQQIADRMRWRDSVQAGGDSLSPRRAAYYANKLLSEWAKSDNTDFAAHHLPEELNNREAVFEAVKPLAERMWANLNDPKAKDKERDLPLSFDHTVKMWALSGRVPDTDVLFWDEAQDVNPVMEGIVRNIRAAGVQVVAVGDSNQAIYGFRGATDALGRLPADATATLTQTFRFGDDVADAGNRFLRLTGSRMRLRGWDRKDSRRAQINPGDETMLIARTNAGVVLGAVEGLQAGRKVAVAGGLNDLRKFLEAAQALQAGKRTTHQDLAQFNGMGWDAIREEVEGNKDHQQLESMFKLMDRHNDSLQALLDSVSMPRPLVEDDGEHLWVKFSFGDSNFEATKDWLKRQGFGWDGVTKRWGYPPPKKGSHVPEQERTRVLQKVEQYIADRYTAPATGNGGQIVDQSAPHDLLVSTAHKAKGLESERVRIADDFRGPKETPEGGIDWDTIPADEELRLAYVAVTRATDVLDTGSLGWVFDATREDDPLEEPDGEYTRDWEVSDFQVGNNLTFWTEDGESLTEGSVREINGTVMTVRTPSGSTEEITPSRVARREGQDKPLLPVASPEELDAALRDGRFVPPQGDTVRISQDEVRETLERIRLEINTDEEDDNPDSGVPDTSPAPESRPEAPKAPAAPIGDASPRSMSNEDIEAELEALKAWQDRHASSAGEGPRVEGNLHLAIMPVGNRRGDLWDEQRLRENARLDQEKKEKAKQVRAAALARTEIGKRNEDGSYPISVDGNDAGTVSQSARKWRWTNSEGNRSPDEYSSRAEAAAALVGNVDVRQSNAEDRDRQEQARGETPDGWVLGDRADVAENDIIRLPVNETDREGRPYPVRWRDPVRVVRAEHRDDGTVGMTVESLDGSGANYVSLSHPDQTFAWAEDRTRPEPTPEWRHELRARMADIGDDIATLRRHSEGVGDQDRMLRLQELIQRTEEGRSEDLQADLRLIRDETAWLEEQFSNPDLPYASRTYKSWAAAASIKAQRALDHPSFQHDSIDASTTNSVPDYALDLGDGIWVSKPRKGSGPENIYVGGRIEGLIGQDRGRSRGYYWWRPWPNHMRSGERFPTAEDAARAFAKEMRERNLPALSLRRVDDEAGPRQDDRARRALELFDAGINAVGGESLPELQELGERLYDADSADDREAEIRDIADRMGALAEQYELAGPQGELAADRFRRAARIARGEQDEQRDDDQAKDEREETTSSPENDDKQREGDQEDEERRDGDADSADPDGKPDSGTGAPGRPNSDDTGDGPDGESEDDDQDADVAQDGDEDDEQRRRRRRRHRNGGPGGPGLPHLNLPDFDTSDAAGGDGGNRGAGDRAGGRRHPDTDSLRNAWRNGEGLTPAEDTPERRVLLSDLADREGLALSPDGGLVTYPETQSDGTTLWRFTQARNGSGLPGITLASDNPDDALELASRFEDLTDLNGDPFAWHQVWDSGMVAAWRDGEGRSLPEALRTVRDDYERERSGGFRLPEDLTDMSIEDLEAAFLNGLGPEDVQRLAAEMDRRDGFVDARIRDAVPDTPPANAAEEEARGRAMDEALRFGDTDVTQPAAATPGRMRREFDALNEERYQAAMEATGGRMLSPKAEAQGVDPRAVFSGRKYTNKQALELASPELRRWIDGDDTTSGNGRLTYAGYRQREADRVLRDEFAEWDEARYRQAIDATNGYFFRREYKFRTAGVNERDLFSGGSLAARERWRQYASEELQEWFDANGGRQTFAQYKQARRDGDRAERHQYEEEQNRTTEETQTPVPVADDSPASGASQNGETEQEPGGRDQIQEALARVEVRPGHSSDTVWLDGQEIGHISNINRSRTDREPLWEATPFFGFAEGRGTRSPDRDTAIANLVAQALQDGPADPLNPNDHVWDSVKAHLAGLTHELPDLPPKLQNNPEARARHDRLKAMIDAFRAKQSPSGDLRQDLAQARDDFAWLRSSLPDTRKGGAQRDALSNLDNRVFWARLMLEAFGPSRDLERPRGDDTSGGEGTRTPGVPTPDAPENAPEPTPVPAATPDPAPEPEPIGGQPAHWARVGDLVPGDMVRMTGTTRQGRRVQRAGFVGNTGPQLVDVTRRGRTEQMWRTWVTENPDGTGASGNVYTSASATAARAEAPDNVVPGSPASGAQSSLRSGDLPGQVPAARDGRGLFPGSTVTGPNGREGVVTGATDTTVSVNWSDGDDEDTVSPISLTVVDSQRPDGWTADGQRVTDQSVVSDTDGALLGPVDRVDGDDVFITTAIGPVTLSAGYLRVTGEVREDVPAMAPVTGIDEPTAADLVDGDVVLLDLDGTLATVAITETPDRAGDRVTLRYADTTTGEVGEIDVDARAVFSRVLGPDGAAPELGPNDAPVPDEGQTVHPAPHGVEPVTGPVIDPELDRSEREVIGDHADGPDDNPDAHQAAVRITADLPVTSEQASALAEQLRAAADTAAPEGRAALRAADRLDRAAGRTPPPGFNRPRPANVAQLAGGDLVAMPADRDTDPLRVYRVVGDPIDAPGDIRSLHLEDEDGRRHHRIEHGALPVWLLPEAEPDPVTPPDPDDTAEPPAAPSAPSTPSTSGAPASAGTPPTPEAPAVPVARARPGDLRIGDVIDAPVNRTGYRLNGHRRLTVIGAPQRSGWWTYLTGMDEDGNVHDVGLHANRTVNVYDRGRATPALPPAGAPRDPNPAPETDVDRLVGDHTRSMAARIIQEAIAGTEPASSIHALREQIAQRLTAEALRDARQAVRRDGAAALDTMGISGQPREEAQRRLHDARKQAHKATVRAALRTINDLEPLPDESNEDLAARARDLLRLIPDQIANRERAAGGDAETTRAVTGHVNEAVNALLQQLQEAGVDPGDAERIARILAQQMGGSRQRTARRIASRVAAASPAVGRQPGILAQIVALLMDMAKRLVELVKAAVRKIAEKYSDARERMARLRAFLGRMVQRVRQWPEARRLARLHRAVALPDADGDTLAARVSHWAGLMPEEGRFGQSQRRVTFWRPATWGRLAAGRLPGRSDRIRWTPDRVADGGPGLSALRHMAALRAAGTDVDQDVTRRLSAALGNDFGDSPHDTLQDADDHVASSERRLVNLQAARSGATIPDDPDLEIEIEAARIELTAARRQYADLRTRYAAAVPDAVAAALGDVRDMGPEGSSALVFGPATDPDAERAVRGVQRLIPRSWLSAPETRRLTAVNGDQGRYEPEGQRITVADLADGGLGTAGYALAQHLAKHLEDLDAAQRAYWFSRTHTGRPGARRMRPSALDRLLRRQRQTQPETGDTLARSIQAMFSGDWYQDDDLRAFLLGLMATR